VADLGDTAQGRPSLPRGAHVVLVVSRGLPQDEPSGFVTVPSLVGHSQQSALNRIEETGLRAEVFAEDVGRAARDVVDQYPVPGAATPTGSHMLLLVSSGLSRRAELVPMPDVVGMAEPDAVARLDEAALEADIVRESHPNVPAGVVLAQLPGVSALAAEKPAARTRWWLLAAIGAVALLMLAGLAALLLLGGTGPQIAVPNLVGLSSAQAQRTLATAHLTLGTVSPQAGSSAPEDSVLSQVPPAGAKVRSGSLVTIVVAASRPKVAVPQLIGMSESDADKALAAAGIAGTVGRAYSNSVPAGSVVSQAPLAPALVDVGSTVQLTISLGPSANTVAVPDLVGLQQAIAQDNVTSAGLTSRVINQYSSAYASGVVADQSPAKNESLVRNATVGVSVSLGPAPTTAVNVSSVIGESSANANSVLVSLGLNVVSIQRDNTGIAADTVASQLPSAAAQVPPGATVIVFVSTGK
jgi:beta-lactam-binding protein with PASTA domain